MTGSLTVELLRVHGGLFSRFGDPGWWPGDSPFEIAVGALLTQNTSWKNVERAISNLKEMKILAPDGILNCDDEILKKAIRPSGYFNQKSVYLRNLCRLITDVLEGDVRSLRKMSLDEARNLLLGINGIGKETADSILCYGAGFAILVVDAYTWRILLRIFGPLLEKELSGRSYDDLASLLMHNLEGDTTFYNRFHALMVLLGKDICRKKPHCNICPISDHCRYNLRETRNDISGGGNKD